jgi:tRNA (uracil-5-)-methyltransferase
MMTNDDGPAETVVAVTAEDRPLPEQPESKLPNGDPLSSEKPQVSDVDETAKVVSGAPTPPSSTPAKITTNRTRTSIRRVPSVGCMASGWSGGVSRPHPCQNIPTEACALVDVVDDFLSTSPIPPYQQRTHSGLWRLLTVRMSRRTRECMVLIQHASPAAANKGDTNDETSEDYSSVWESERQRLIDMLTNATLPTHTRQYEQGGILTTMTNDVLVNDESNVLRVTSIFFQEFDGLSTPSPDHPVQVRSFMVFVG